MGFRIQFAITFFILAAKVTFDCASAQAFAQAGALAGTQSFGGNGNSPTYGGANAQGFGNYQTNSGFVPQTYNGAASQANSGAGGSSQAGNNWSGGSSQAGNNWSGGSSQAGNNWSGGPNQNNVGPAQTNSAPSQTTGATAQAAAGSTVPANGVQNNGLSNAGGLNGLGKNLGLSSLSTLGLGNTFNEMMKNAYSSAISVAQNRWQLYMSKWMSCLASPASTNRIQQSANAMQAAGWSRTNWSQLLMQHWTAVKISNLTLSLLEVCLLTTVELLQALVLALKTGNLSCVYTAAAPTMQKWMTSAVQAMQPMVSALSSSLAGRK